MGKYLVVKLLYSISGQRYIHPGETLELDNPEVEARHLERGEIRPMEIKTKRAKRLEEDLNDGTNDQ